MGKIVLCDASNFICHSTLERMQGFMLSDNFSACIDRQCKVHFAKRSSAWLST